MGKSGKKSNLESEIKEELKGDLRLKFITEAKENEINWISGENWTWDNCKGYSKKLWGHKKEFCEEKIKWFFLAHDNDSIVGKPQLIEEVQKKIPLSRLAIKKGKDEYGEEIMVQSIYFFDEKFDKRNDGFQQDAFALDFWMYRVITKEGKDYFILSQKQLQNQNYTFKGMIVELDDFAEISRNMKIKSLSRLFFLKESVPATKILSPEEIVNYTKEKKIDELDWNLFLNYHPNGNINIFDDDVQMLRSAVVLSGKRDGYPLHLGIMGKAGTKKSMGWLETLDYKFSEEGRIIGGGNTRAKALTPSFKEKPADIGYFAKVERMGFIDEIGKMAEMDLQKNHGMISTNLFGEWTDLLDCKKRSVGSGNNNTCTVEPNAKHIFPTNPISNRETIHAHVGLLDAPMMSRVLWWVQDEAESNFLRSSNSVLRISPDTCLRVPEMDENSPYTYASMLKKIKLIENRKKDIGLYKCWGKVGSRDDFITLFDSVNNFTCKIDELEVERLKNSSLAIAKNPMKDDVWKPRADHHIFLLIDGICKTRCLFRDYDPNFIVKEEDYDLAERILTRMVKAWDTDLSPKEDFS